MKTSTEVDVQGDGASGSADDVQATPSKKKSTTSRKSSVHFRFDQKTSEVIDELTDAVGQTNRTELVSKALLLANYLLDETQKGAEIYLKQPNGEMEKLPSLELLLY